jgi:Arc/MetJ-type ribon-helix-helix transcriptional regulator
MPRRTIRLSTDENERIRSAAKLRGYSSSSSFLRAAIQKELGEREDGMIGTEERLGASIEQVRWEVFRLGRTHQAFFAFVDSLAKVLSTCIPEPDGEAVEAAVARARGRHARLLKSAGQAMAGELLWKLTGSPEFGDRADLKQLPRDLVSRMENDLGTTLQRVAAARFKTEHPHMHMALRGIRGESRPLQFNRDHVKAGHPRNRRRPLHPPTRESTRK